MLFRKCLMVVFLVSSNSYAQNELIPIPDLIALSKKATIPVISRQSNWPADSFAMGTAVILGQQTSTVLHIAALTCEHVIATKDSANRTLRYHDQIFLLMNRKDGTVQPMKQQIAHVDEKNDFAILVNVHDSLQDSLVQHLYFKIIPPQQWKETKDFREGETVLYLGYPMSIGVGRKSSPLSRIGIVSQLVSGSSFLIDGFVQHGHSGSPVFLIRRERNEWARYLVGITRGFPNEYSNVLEQRGFKKDSSKIVILNPGFTSVTSMDCVIPVMTGKLGYIR